MDYSEKDKREMRDNLKSKISKKFETAGIGCLYSVEQAFGSLWGQDKPYNELSETELINRNIWQQLRTEILDKCHRERKNSLKELDCYEVISKRFHTTFVMMNKSNPNVNDDNFGNVK